MTDLQLWRESAAPQRPQRAKDPSRVCGWWRRLDVPLPACQKHVVLFSALHPVLQKGTRLRERDGNTQWWLNCFLGAPVLLSNIWAKKAAGHERNRTLHNTHWALFHLLRLSPHKPKSLMKEHRRSTGHAQGCSASRDSFWLFNPTEDPKTTQDSIKFPAISQ